jgi:hypothetical protein
LPRRQESRIGRARRFHCKRNSTQRPLASTSSKAVDPIDRWETTSGRGEIPLSIELAGGPERVLTLVAFDAAATGIQIHIGGPGSELGTALQQIATLIEHGRLTVPWRSYPLAQTAAALDASQSSHLHGKIVIVP